MVRMKGVVKETVARGFLVPGMPRLTVPEESRFLIHSYRLNVRESVDHVFTRQSRRYFQATMSCSESTTMYILAINCGSSSIKGKLYPIPISQSEPLLPTAHLGVSNISSKGEKVKMKVGWEGGKGKDVDEEGEDGGSVDCEATSHEASSLSCMKIARWSRSCWSGYNRPAR